MKYLINRTKRTINMNNNYFLKLKSRFHRNLKATSKIKFMSKIDNSNLKYTMELR